MARLAFVAALAVGAAVAFGCGPAKELPDEVPKSPEPTEQPVASPKSSEAAAKEYVEKAVKAYTGGKPELLAKGKASRSVLKGKMLFPTAGGQKALVDVTRTTAAVWPDRLHITHELPAMPLTVETWLRRPHLTVRRGAIEVDMPNRAEYEQGILADGIGQLWLMFLFPLADEKAVVFDLRTQSESLPSGQPVEVRTLSLALPDLPQYHLTFDGKTDALLRVDYAAMELGVKHRKQWFMADHKPGPEGLLLPTKMEFRLDNVTAEEWTAEKWEFPASLPDEEFTPQRK